MREGVCRGGRGIRTSGTQLKWPTSHLSKALYCMHSANPAMGRLGLGRAVMMTTRSVSGYASVDTWGNAFCTKVLRPMGKTARCTLRASCQ